MYYYLYEVKNIINGKIYVGVHKTEVLDDGYMGSGKVIISAINKYGIGNFSKTILEYFTNASDMFSREKELVTDEFLLREDVYNLRRGGAGGFDYINKSGFIMNSSHYGSGSIKASKGGIATRNSKSAIFSEESRHRAVAVLRERYPNGTFYKKSHSAETKIKMQLSHIGGQVGSNNSQFGSMWITDGQLNMKINKESTVPAGWWKGRKINK
jgi:hypothetical protein